MTDKKKGGPIPFHFFLIVATIAHAFSKNDTRQIVKKKFHYQSRVRHNGIGRRRRFPRRKSIEWRALFVLIALKEGTQWPQYGGECLHAPGLADQSLSIRGR